MSTLRVRGGSIIGRDHMLSQKNRQDAFAIREAPGMVAAFVCDGCGSGEHSEVGAALAAPFLAEFCMDFMLNTKMPLMKSITAIELNLMNFLDDIAKAAGSFSKREAFVKDYLLFTILGIVIHGSKSIVIAAGDGSISTDTGLYPRNQNNEPRYFSYNLNYPDEWIDLDVFTPSADWKRLAVATDGFETDLFSELPVDSLKRPRSLQRKLNKWSNEDKRFKDDATIVVVDRLDEVDHADQA